MRWIPDPEPGPPRVAFAIARRVGTAVTRNRVRRQLWHHLLERARAGDGLEGGAYLISVQAGTPPDADLRSDLDHALAAAARP